MILFLETPQFWNRVAKLNIRTGAYSIHNIQKESELKEMKKNGRYGINSFRFFALFNIDMKPYFYHNKTLYHLDSQVKAELKVRKLINTFILKRGANEIFRTWYVRHRIFQPLLGMDFTAMHHEENFDFLWQISFMLQEDERIQWFLDHYAPASVEP